MLVTADIPAAPNTVVVEFVVKGNRPELLPTSRLVTMLTLLSALVPERLLRLLAGT